ncbi:MAG: metallophosphoesterase [Candidatus Aenigmarchaeota archaeon]|nr:metallophosphoesterase [Candidatus Aenigmarchaeota archaeon]
MKEETPCEYSDNQSLAVKNDDKDAKRLKSVVSAASLSHSQLEHIIQRINDPQPTTLPTEIHRFSKNAVRFLIVGDLHLNAKESITKKPLCDFRKFKKVLHIAKEEGAEYILQTGDVSDGENMRSEQKYSLVVQGEDNVIEYCSNVWPDCGLRTFFIGGNHDQTYMKSIGSDICAKIAAKRKDLIYLGMNEGNLPLQPEYIKKILEGKGLPSVGPTWMRIRHPAKGTAKSQSYQPQAHIEALHSEFKPRILVIGHYHKMDYLFERNVHCFQAGAMEKQSDWMRTHDLQAHLGAWLVTCYYKEDGTIDGVRKRKLEYEVNGNEKWGKLMEMGVYEGK